MQLTKFSDTAYEIKALSGARVLFSKERAVAAYAPTTGAVMTCEQLEPAQADDAHEWCQDNGWSRLPVAQATVDLWLESHSHPKPRQAVYETEQDSTLLTDDAIVWAVDEGNADTWADAIADLLKQRVASGKTTVTLTVLGGEVTQACPNL